MVVGTSTLCEAAAWSMNEGEKPEARTVVSILVIAITCTWTHPQIYLIFPTTSPCLPLPPPLVPKFSPVTKAGGKHTHQLSSVTELGVAEIHTWCEELCLGHSG
jgi:hypothetical protein